MRALVTILIKLRLINSKIELIKEYDWITDWIE